MSWQKVWGIWYRGTLRFPWLIESITKHLSPYLRSDPRFVVLQRGNFSDNDSYFCGSQRRSWNSGWNVHVFFSAVSISLQARIDAKYLQLQCLNPGPQTISHHDCSIPRCKYLLTDSFKNDMLYYHLPLHWVQFSYKFHLRLAGALQKLARKSRLFAHLMRDTIKTEGSKFFPTYLFEKWSPNHQQLMHRIFLNHVFFISGNLGNATTPCGIARLVDLRLP